MQTFGDLVTFNPHIHALVADGVFLPSGRFRVLPPLPEAALCEALRYKLLDLQRTEGVLEAGLADHQVFITDCTLIRQVYQNTPLHC